MIYFFKYDMVVNTKDISRKTTYLCLYIISNPKPIQNERVQKKARGRNTKRRSQIKKPCLKYTKKESTHCPPPKTPK